MDMSTDAQSHPSSLKGLYYKTNEFPKRCPLFNALLSNFSHSTFKLAKVRWLMISSVSKVNFGTV